MDTIRVERAYFDKVFDLGNSDTGSGGHDGIEVPRCLAIDKIAPLIALPCFDEGEIRFQCSLEYVRAAIEFARFLSFSNNDAKTRRRKESCDTRTSRPYAFGECPLRIQFDFDLTCQGQFFEQLILSNVRRDDFPNLARFKEKPYTQAIYAGVVTNDGEIPNTFFACGINEIFRKPTKAEAAGHDRGAILQICDRFARVRHGLIHSDSPCLNRLSISSKFPPSIESRTR